MANAENETFQMRQFWVIFKQCVLLGQFSGIFAYCVLFCFSFLCEGTGASLEIRSGWSIFQT